MAEDTLSDSDIDAAIERGRLERAQSPLPSSVRYDKSSRRIVVEFVNGATFMVPARALQDLDEASEEELADVFLLGETGLHWERLDVDFSIAGLMNGVFGTATFMDMARKGSQSTSPGETEAARLDGAKGGHPRKAS